MTKDELLQVARDLVAEDEGTASLDALTEWIAGLFPVTEKQARDASRRALKEWKS